MGRVFGGVGGGRFVVVVVEGGGEVAVEGYGGVGGGNGHGWDWRCLVVVVVVWGNRVRGVEVDGCDDVSPGIVVAILQPPLWSRVDGLPWIDYGWGVLSNVECGEEL